MWRQHFWIVHINEQITLKTNISIWCYWLVKFVYVIHLIKYCYWNLICLNIIIFMTPLEFIFSLMAFTWLLKIIIALWIMWFWNYWKHLEFCANSWIGIFSLKYLFFFNINKLSISIFSPRFDLIFC